MPLFLELNLPLILKICFNITFLHLNFQLAFTQSRYLTVTNLLRCVRDRSCEGPLDPIARQEQEQVSILTFMTNVLKSESILKHFKT
jgi:hypothetical protein